jgi:hypothetical protein
MSGLRYSLTYNGVKLPLRLANLLEASELGHRNTYNRAHYDALSNAKNWCMARWS